MEKYLTVIKNPMLRQTMTRLRISNHMLLIESSRHTHPPTLPEERLCTLRNLKHVKDKPHFLITCPRFSHSRHNICLLQQMQPTPILSTYHQQREIYLHINIHQQNLIWCLAKCIHNAMKLRSALLLPPV